MEHQRVLLFGSLKQVVKDIILALRNNYELHAQYASMRAGENARIISTDPNEQLTRAYEYHLSKMFPVQVSVTDEDVALFKKVQENYSLAINYMRQNDAAVKFISGPSEAMDWDKITAQFRTLLLEGDYTSILASYGGRSYKNATPLPTRFDRVSSESIVAEAINMYEAIIRKYSPSGASYQGYSNFYYPHTMYRGAILNQFMYPFETGIFVEQNLEHPQVVAEIGAGDGAVAREIIRRTDAKYVIYDLPEVLTRANLFLADAFSDTKKVAGMVEYFANGQSVAKTLEAYDVLCLPCWFADDVDVEIDLWVNTHSLGEMPVNISRRYVEIINETGKAFLSINSETVRDYGECQIHPSCEYLGRLSNMQVAVADFPLSSNHFFLDPYYSRFLFRRI